METQKVSVRKRNIQGRYNSADVKGYIFRIFFWDRCLFLWFPSGTGAYVCILFWGRFPWHIFALYVWTISTSYKFVWLKLRFTRFILFLSLGFESGWLKWDGGSVCTNKFCTPRQILLKNTHLKKSRNDCTFRWISETDYNFSQISGTEYAFQDRSR